MLQKTTHPALQRSIQFVKKRVLQRFKTAIAAVFWILRLGVWEDDGVWDDTDTWND